MTEAWQAPRAETPTARGGLGRGFKQSPAVACTAEHPVSRRQDGVRGPSGIRVLLGTTEWWDVFLVLRTCFHSWGFD